MTKGMPNSGAGREHFGEQTLVPRAMTEIRRDHARNTIRGVLDRLRELGKVGTPSAQTRRAITQKGFALPLQDSRQRIHRWRGYQFTRRRAARCEAIVHIASLRAFGSHLRSKVAKVRNTSAVPRKLNQDHRGAEIYLDLDQQEADS